MDKSERVTPASKDAEMSILAASMLDKTALTAMIEKLTVSDFYYDDHILIFEVIKELVRVNSPIDYITVATGLENKGNIDNTLDYRYLMDIIDILPSSANYEEYISIIKDKSIKRELLKSCEKIKSLVYSNNKIDKILDDSQNIILEVNKMSLSDSMSHISEVIDKEIEITYEMREKGLKLNPEIIQTGLSGLDEALNGGLNPSDLVLIAARPAMGKSAKIINIARGVAGKGSSVGIFSLEMPNSQIAQRLISAESEISLPSVKNRILNDVEYDKYMINTDKLSKLPIYLDDKVNIDINTLKTKIRKLKKRCDKPDITGKIQPLKVVMVDYLQIMDFDDSNIRIELGKITKGLKQLAKELNINVIALSQLSRDVEKRPNKRPQLSDLRESGNLEQDCDICIFLYRDEYYNPTTTTKSRIAELIIAKHRNGATGTIEEYFDGEYSKFTSLEK